MGKDSSSILVPLGKDGGSGKASSGQAETSGEGEEESGSGSKERTGVELES